METTKLFRGTFALLVMLSFASCDAVDAWNRSRQMRTLNRIRSLSIGIEEIRDRDGKYPETAGARIADVLPSTFAPQVERKDAWGNELRYVGIDDEYWILSPGSDDRYELDDPRKYKMGGTTGLERDFVLRSGAWWSWPDGAPGG